MARGKSQFATWNCTECKAGNYISAYNKKSNDKVKKELNKFCKNCHKRTVHRRKDTKKAAK